MSQQVRVSIVVPTYKRGEELVVTLRQIRRIMSECDELIVVDQSPSNPPEVAGYFEELAREPGVTILRVSRPSVTLARNIGVLNARAPVVVFLDDDVDVDQGLIEQHLAYYDAPDVIGVAGAFYMGTKALLWKPSGTARAARALTGLHMSFRRDAMLRAGGEDTNFAGGGPGEDWEFGERMRRLGRLANGAECVVFHRAPKEGGAGNQRFRGAAWYREAYHNHVYWMLKRPWPDILTRLPRHFYWIARYNIPHRSVLIDPKFLFWAVPSAILGAVRTRLSGHRPPYWPDPSVVIERWPAHGEARVRAAAPIEEGVPS